MSSHKKVVQQEENAEEEESEQGSNVFDEDEYDSDGIEMPEFVNPESLEQDDAEIEYYAKKLGLDGLDEWDEDMNHLGYSKIFKDLTVGKRTKDRKEKTVKMVKAVRTEEEEAARKEFTGYLNRIVPSNYNVIAHKIRDVFMSHPPAVSITMFTRCLTQRIFSDAELPACFISVYSKILQEIPEAVHDVIEKLRDLPPDHHNAKPFLEALGPSFISFASAPEAKMDKEVADISQAAREMKMLTDVRRDVFVAITTAVDVIDAYCKVTKLNLSKTQKHEIPFVIFQCCRKEASYNPFYAALTAHFIENDKKIAKGVNVTIKNALKLMYDYEVPQLKNCAIYTAELIESEAINLDILRGVTLMRLEPKSLVFAKLLIRELFQKWDMTKLQDEITRIEQAPNFAKDLGKFLKHRVIEFAQKAPNFSPDRMQLLKLTADRLSFTV